MLTPQEYLRENEEKNLYELYSQKEELERIIQDYESGKNIAEELSLKERQLPIFVINGYKKYLVKLNELIEQKETNKQTETKYIEIDEFTSLYSFLRNAGYFDNYKVKEVNYDGKELSMVFKSKDAVATLIATGIRTIEMNLRESNKVKRLYIGYKDGFILNLNNNEILVNSENVKLRIIDKSNAQYTYASVKYKDDDVKTFYYISEIENLNPGDYAYVSVKDSYRIAKVEHIENYTLENVPFPVEKAKRIIRKASKYEYDNQEEKQLVNSDDGYSFSVYRFEFTNRETLCTRCTKLPILKKQDIRYEEENGKWYPVYEGEAKAFAEKFYELKLNETYYESNYNDIQGLSIEELDFEESLSVLTYILNSESFSEGIFAERIKDGTIENLVKQMRMKFITPTNISDANIDEIKQEHIDFFSLRDVNINDNTATVYLIDTKDDDIKIYSGKYISLVWLSTLLPAIAQVQFNITGEMSGVSDEYKHVKDEKKGYTFVKNELFGEFEERLNKSLNKADSWVRIALDLLNFEFHFNSSIMKKI